MSKEGENISDNRRAKKKKTVYNTEYNDRVLEAILSNNYIDILVEYEENLEEIARIYQPEIMQVINDNYVILHIYVGDKTGNYYKDIKMTNIPRCFGPYGKRSLDEAGVLVVHNQPYLPLRGEGILIGIVDSGISYTEKVFTYEDNTTKIASIWDQTIQGNPPTSFYYGTEYTREDINQALQSGNPYVVVPSRDTSGHGTFLAGVAGGREVLEENFIGAAPDAELVIVKLKEAKQNIKDMWAIYTDVPVYQNTDIMMGVKYLLKIANGLNKPIVIIVGLGSNLDGHDGTAVIERYLSNISKTTGNVVTVAAGNESNNGHHYRGIFRSESLKDVEINVARGEKGYTFSMWSKVPDKFSISITSPTGEYIERLPFRLSFLQSQSLIIEKTKIFISYELYEERTGDQHIFIRMEEPTEGIWTFTIYGEIIVNGRIDIWLSRNGWIKKNTRFLEPDPYTTVTVPATSSDLLTVGAYDIERIYINSGRGFTRNEKLKPDLVAPGVNVYGPLPNNKFGTMTGTSVSAAITGGAAALLLEWGIIFGYDRKIDTQKVKNYLIRGAIRKENIEYPNRVWGYGELNLYNTLKALRDIKYK